jgi:hypothetical protein
MARGNGTVNVRPVACYMPEPLLDIIKTYQDDTVLPSVSMAILRLLESHPAIVSRITEVYDRASTGRES